MARLAPLLLNDLLQSAEQAATDSFVGFGFRGKNQLDLFLIGCVIPFMQ